MVRIAETRSRGYAVVDQEVELGLCSIAVPLYGMRGRIVAALNTGVAAVQAGPEELVNLYLSELLRVQDGLRRILA